VLFAFKSMTLKNVAEEGEFGPRAPEEKVTRTNITGIAGAAIIITTTTTGITTIGIK
jgi:hypothetical protein